MDEREKHWFEKHELEGKLWSPLGSVDRSFGMEEIYQMFRKRMLNEMLEQFPCENDAEEKDTP